MKKLYAIIALCLFCGYTVFSQTISSNAPLCGNANLTLELTATGGSTYAWTGPNGFTSTLQKPTIKNVNWKNRGVYTVIVDGKTTLTTEVNIKDPVAFTVPKEITVYRASTLLIEPKNSRLTDSTEVPVSYSFVTPKGNTMSGNVVPVVLENETGNYKVVGNSGSSGCSVTQNVKVSINNKTLGDKMIEIVSLSNVKICFGQDFAIPFYPQPASYFKEGTKYKVYLIKRGELLSTSRQPDVIVDKSPAILKGLKDNVGINSYERVLIVADDPEQTKGISDFRQFPNSQYLTSYYNSYINTTSIVCDSAKLSVNDGNNINSIQWFQDGIAITGANSKDFLTKKSGTFTYKFKGNLEPYEIDKTCLFESRPIKIELGKIDKPYVSVFNDTELCVGKSVTLGISPKTNTNYRWKKDGNYITNATNSSYQTLQEGKYQIEAKEGNCTAVSDTVVLKKPERLTDIYYDIRGEGSNSQTIYKYCSNPNFYFVFDNVPIDARYQVFKDKNLVLDVIGRQNINFKNFNEEGDYFIKTSYGECTGITRTYSIKFEKTINISNSNKLVEICDKNASTIIGFNSPQVVLNNSTLFKGSIYKDGKNLNNWRIDLTKSTSNLEVNQAGNYYGIGKIIFKDGNECNITTDTIKVNFTKKIQSTSSTFDPKLNAVPLTVCSDTATIYGGGYDQATSYKWTKDGVVLKQDSSNVLQATQTGIYQLETTTKGSFCPIISPPYKVELGKMKVDFFQWQSPNICDGENYPLYQILSENSFSNKNITDIYKDGKLYKANTSSIPSVTYPYYLLNESGTYKLTVKNGKCEGTSPDFVLKVDKIPTTITPTDTDSVTFCTGKTVDLKASTEAGLSYIWERNGSVISQANQAALTASIDGLYKAILLRGGCWGTTPNVKLKSLANIIPTATLTGDKKIDLDQETKLSINLTSHAPWTFKLSDGKEYTATKSPFEITVKPLRTTTYILSEVNNICGTGTVSGTAKIEVIILSIEEERELFVEVFPMPSSEICHWKMETPQISSASVVLYDGLGIEQFSSLSPTRSQTHQGTIDLTNLKAGTYFLKLQAGEKNVTRKVIKL